MQNKKLKGQSIICNKNEFTYFKTMVASLWNITKTEKTNLVFHKW